MNIIGNLFFIIALGRFKVFKLIEQIWTKSKQLLILVSTQMRYTWYPWVIKHMKVIYINQAAHSIFNTC